MICCFTHQHIIRQRWSSETWSPTPWGELPLNGSPEHKKKHVLPPSRTTIEQDHTMMTSSNGNFFALLAICAGNSKLRVTGLCAGNSPVPGEFPAQRPVTRSLDIFFDLRLNKQVSKQSWGWWFEMLSCPIWRHCNADLWRDVNPNYDIRNISEPQHYTMWYSTVSSLIKIIIRSELDIEHNEHCIAYFFIWSIGRHFLKQLPCFWNFIHRDVTIFLLC